MPGSDPMQASCSPVRSWPAKGPRRFACLAAVLLLACSICPFASPQEEPQIPVQPQPQPEDSAGAPADSVAPSPLANLPRATIHGMVKNAATGEPLPRALVRIEGDAVSGALTDGDGRFEISGVPLGPQAFQVM